MVTAASNFKEDPLFLEMMEDDCSFLEVVIELVGCYQCSSPLRLVALELLAHCAQEPALFSFFLAPSQVL